MADAPAPGSPLAWLKTLDEQLEARRREIQTYSDYFDGKHPLAFATPKFRETFGSLFGAFADNWCELVVNASVERLHVQGFRFGGQDEPADDAAWGIWQRNNLDQGSRIGMTEAVKLGTAYLIVDRDADGKALITTEHPFQVIHAPDPTNRRVRQAALKKWLDASGYVMATVYLPDGAYKFQSQQPYSSAGNQTRELDWIPRRNTDEVAANPTPGVVPVVPLENNPMMLEGGQSDLKKVIPIQTAIDKLATDMLVASEFAAFRQRWATGLEVPKDPETGQPLMSRQEFQSSVSRLWTVADPETKFGEFDVTDLSNYVKAIEMFVNHLAAQTKTPPHYLMGQIVNASGDALKAAEAGLVTKVNWKKDDFGEAFEEALRLAFRVEGDDTRAEQTDAETIWANSEVRTEGETVAALVQMRTLGVPLEALWERWGASPQEIERWKTLAGLPDRPPPGGTTADTPPPIGPFGGDPTPRNGQPENVAPPRG